jgi:hypothetical protein
MANKFVLTSAIIATFAYPISPARAECWSGESISAAKLVDFEIMLETSLKRCIAETPSLKLQYGDFKKTNAVHFINANNMLKQHFAKSDDTTNVGKNYRDFVDEVSRSYSITNTKLKCSDFVNFTKNIKSEHLDYNNVDHLHNITGSFPTLVGKRCARRLSVAQSVAPQ